MVRTTLRTNLHSLYDHVHIKGSCKEKRLVVKLNPLKEALGNGQLTNLEWLGSELQLSDGLTKHMKALSMLKTLNSRILP